MGQEVKGGEELGARVCRAVRVHEAAGACDLQDVPVAGHVGAEEGRELGAELGRLPLQLADLAAHLEDHGRVGLGDEEEGGRRWHRVGIAERVYAVQHIKKYENTYYNKKKF